MSQHNLIPTNIKNRGGLSTTLNYNPRNEWVRNPLWLSLPSFTDGEQKIAGVWAVQNNIFGYASFKVSGAYSVDWGDGTTNTYSAATICTHVYDYNNAAFDDTDRPVTLTVSTNTINRTSHNLTNGTKVQFFNLVNTIGIEQGLYYFVINSTPNTFQIAFDPNGSPVTFSGTDGSATLLPYKQAIIIITPQAANNLTSIDFASNSPPSGVSINYTFGTSWIDICLSGNNFTSFGLSSNATVVAHPLLVKISFLMKTIAMTIWSFKFQNCYALEYVPYVPLPVGLGNVWVDLLFGYCFNLLYGPFMDTSSVTRAIKMFIDCRRLRSIPSYNFANIDSAEDLFYGCGSLQELPALNFSSCTSARTTFYSCSSLKKIAGITTSTLLTNVLSMFYGCSNLEDPPFFNTSNVTNATQMFMNSGVYTVPKYDFSSVTTGLYIRMFLSCSRLRYISPLTSSTTITSLQDAFNSTSIRYAPSLNTANVTSILGCFGSCGLLQEIPAWDVSSVTNTYNAVGNCSNLRRVQWTGMKVSHSFGGCMMANTQLQEVFTNLGIPATQQTITITGNPGVDTAVSKTSCGTTAGSNTITQTNTVGLSTGMLVTGPNVSTNMAVTFTASTSLVNRTAHGLSNNHIVSFDTISDTTGINVYTRYYVVNATADAFQVANTASGTALTLTTDGSGTMLYGSYINSISTNTSFTLDKPASATGTSTLTARLLDSSIATMKNWAVTF